MSMTRSDFVWVNFDESFNPLNNFASRRFWIDGSPTGAGYLLIQARDVDLPQASSESFHRIQINGMELPAFDIPFQEGNQRWTTWMDNIPSGFLRYGLNWISIRRVSDVDSFDIASVAINWRESNRPIFQGPDVIQAPFSPLI